MAKHKRRMNRKMKELILTLIAFAAVAGIIFIIIIWDGAPTIRMAITKYYDAVGKRDNGKYISIC